MNLIRQPKGTNVCGQCCVAMITGAELAEVVTALGSGRTSTAKLRALLRLMGYEVGERRALPRKVVVEAPWPTAPTALLRVKWLRTTRSHWMVWHVGTIYDPGSGIWGPEEWVTSAGKAGRLTSYWGVERRIR